MGEIEERLKTLLLTSDRLGSYERDEISYILKLIKNLYE